MNAKDAAANSDANCGTTSDAEAARNPGAAPSADAASNSGVALAPDVAAERSTAAVPRFDGELEDDLAARVLAMLREVYAPDYRFFAPRPVPWTPLRRPLADARVVLVTTGGLHRRDDAPFAALERREGDASFRRVPHLLSREQLALDAPYVDAKYTATDPECALPSTALQSLVDDGLVGGAAAEHVSFCGGVVEPYPGLEDAVEALLPSLREQDVDAAVVLPTCSICVQTAGIVARELERRGIATCAVTLIPELSRIVGTPRTLAVKFPFGAPCGDPGHASLHRAVLHEALRWIVDAPAPGAERRTQHAWRREPE